MEKVAGAVLFNLLLQKLDFDFFTEYLLNRDGLSRSENTQTTFESETESLREKPNENTILKAANAMMQYTITRTIGELVIVNRGFEETLEIEILLEKRQRKPMRETFEAGIRDKLFYQPTLEVLKEGLSEMIHYKLADDIYAMKTTLESTIIELQSHGSFEKLNTKLGTIQKEQQEVHDIIYDYVKSVEYLKYLEAKHIFEIENWRILKEDWEEEYQHMQEAVDDYRIISCIESRCINKWCDTRLEQRVITIENERNALIQQLDDVNKNYKNETDITNDIEEYLDSKITEVDGLIDRWMARCDTEIDAMDDEIQVLTETNNALEVRAQVAMDEYISHKKEMEDFWEKKRLEAERILLEQKKLKFAIRIQAWWRGTMVRRHLGPFRRHKRRGKGRKGRGKKAKGGKKAKEGKKAK